MEEAFTRQTCRRSIALLKPSTRLLPAVTCRAPNIPLLPFTAPPQKQRHSLQLLYVFLPLRQPRLAGAAALAGQRHLRPQSLLVLLWW